MTTYHMKDGAHQKLQVGDEDNAVLIGGSGAWDTMICGNGNECLLQAGTGSHQLVIAGNGLRDTIVGGSGADDTMVGGSHGCKFEFGTGAHQVAHGGPGNDLFHFHTPGAGDTVYGGGGQDTVVFESHDSNHVSAIRQQNELVITFTDIGKIVTLNDIEVVRFSDGKTI